MASSESDDCDKIKNIPSPPKLSQIPESIKNNNDNNKFQLKDTTPASINKEKNTPKVVHNIPVTVNMTLKKAISSSDQQEGLKQIITLSINFYLYFIS